MKISLFTDISYRPKRFFDNDGGIIMLELMIEGGKFEFCIEKYRPSTQENWYDEWCMVTARVKNNVLNYDIHCECILCTEVEWLYKKLGELQDGLITSDTEISFIEPDFEYVLYPNSNGDCYMDWKFSLWNDGILTANSFTIVFDAAEIGKLRKYLNKVMSEARKDD